MRFQATLNKTWLRGKTEANGTLPANARKAANIAVSRQTAPRGTRSG